MSQKLTRLVGNIQERLRSFCNITVDKKSINGQMKINNYHLCVNIPDVVNSVAMGTRTLKQYVQCIFSIIRNDHVLLTTIAAVAIALATTIRQQ